MTIARLMSTCVIFLCNDLINITHHIWHGIDLQYSVKDFCTSIYTLSSSCRTLMTSFLLLPHPIETGNVWGNSSSFLMFSMTFFPNCPHHHLGKASIVIICIVYSIPLVTFQYYWFNVWFSTLDTYLKMQFWDWGQGWFTWEDREGKFDDLFVCINVFHNWGFWRIFDVFHLRWSDFTRPKPNYNLRHWDALDRSVGDKNVTVTSRCVLLRYGWFTSYLALSQSHMIYNLEKQYYTTCSDGAKQVVLSILSVVLQ